MISLIKFIWSFFEQRIVVKRIPGAKALKAHLLGLTFGFAFMAMNLLWADLTTSATLSTITAKLIIALWFALVTYYAGILLISQLVICLVLAIVNAPPVHLLPSSFWGVLFSSSVMHVNGYLVGALFAILYNDFLYLFFHLHPKERKRIRVVFAIDKRKPVNIIKSPQEEEEEALLGYIKPLRYYIVEIRKGNDPDQNAAEIVGLVRRTYNLDNLTTADKGKLLENLPVPHESKEERLVALGQALNSRNEDVLNILYYLVPPIVEKYSAGDGERLRSRIDDIRNGGGAVPAVVLIIESLISALTPPDTADKKDDLRRLIHLIVPFNKHIEELGRLLRAMDSETLDNMSEKVEPVIEKYLMLKKEKLYNYRLSELPEQPYTIVFVANPLIHNRPENRPPEYEDDPIVGDLDLFVKAVHNALASLESDPLLGRPELFSRTRVVTVFKKPTEADYTEFEKNDLAVLEEFQDALHSGGNRIDHNIIKPVVDAHAIVGNILSSIPDCPISCDDIDVIYGVSASPTHDRSFMHFADWPDELTDSHRPGRHYLYDQDPHDEERCCGKGEDIIRPKQDNPFLHDFYARIPGRIAINANAASRYTYLHEFGHAMSSFVNGRIVDEYSDGFVIEDPSANENNKSGDDGGPKINRIDRNYTNSSCHIIPVHKAFATYNCNLFFSDLDHPSAEENWIGYFPERKEHDLFCTMDRVYGAFQYDPLVAAFIHDRLIAKFCRKALLKIEKEGLWECEKMALQLDCELPFKFRYMQALKGTSPQELSNMADAELIPEIQSLASPWHGSTTVTVSRCKLVTFDQKEKSSLVVTIRLHANNPGNPDEYPQYRRRLSAFIRELRKQRFPSEALVGSPGARMAPAVPAIRTIK